MADEPINAESFRKFVEDTAIIGTHTQIEEANDLIRALREQTKLESAVFVHATKIGVLKKMLEEEEKRLSRAAIDAAKHREIVVKKLIGTDGAIRQQKK